MAVAAEVGEAQEAGVVVDTVVVSTTTTTSSLAALLLKTDKATGARSEPEWVDVWRDTTGIKFRLPPTFHQSRDSHDLAILVGHICPIAFVHPVE